MKASTTPLILMFPVDGFNYICIYGFITVLPESSVGSLAVFGAGVAAGSVVYVKAKRRKSTGGGL